MKRLHRLAGLGSVLSTVTLVTYSGIGLVAQVSNLLYRGFLIRNPLGPPTACRLEVGDTVGWKPALRHRICARMRLGIVAVSLIVLADAALASDVGLYAVSKRQVFSQTNPGPPAP